MNQKIITHFKELIEGNNRQIKRINANAKGKFDGEQWKRIKKRLEEENKEYVGYVEYLDGL